MYSSVPNIYLLKSLNSKYNTSLLISFGGIQVDSSHMIGMWSLVKKILFIKYFILISLN